VAFRLEAERPQGRGEPARGGRLVARRVLGVEAEKALEEADRLTVVDVGGHPGHRARPASR
jgi:hypothetical protein